MANFAAMRLLEGDGRFTEPVRMLLCAVSAVPDALMEQAKVLPKRRNWLRFPWYAAAKGGGAFVMGDRIYANHHFFEPQRHMRFLLLLAHEVGHFPHAAVFGTSGWGKARFIGWAAVHYLRSGLVHGRRAHQLARIEQEAERGRWVLGELIKASPADPPWDHLADAKEMKKWLEARAPLLAELHHAYPGWPVDHR